MKNRGFKAVGRAHIIFRTLYRVTEGARDTERKMIGAAREALANCRTVRDGGEWLGNDWLVVRVAGAEDHALGFEPHEHARFDIGQD